MWPWSRKPETFASYTDAFVGALLDAAGGQVVDAGTTAQVEFAAGMWQRTVSSAEVEPSHLGSLITPDVLGSIARGLVLRGQAVGIIEDGGLVLASDCEVTGGPQPSTWRFRVTLDGPTKSTTFTVGYDDMLLFQWSADPSRPWAGIGPLSRASVSAALLARLEGRMSEEASRGLGTSVERSRHRLRDNLQVARGLEDFEGQDGLCPHVEELGQRGGEGLRRRPW